MFLFVRCHYSWWFKVSLSSPSKVDLYLKHEVKGRFSMYQTTAHYQMSQEQVWCCEICPKKPAQKDIFIRHMVITWNTVCLSDTTNLSCPNALIMDSNGDDGSVAKPRPLLPLLGYNGARDVANVNHRKVFNNLTKGPLASYFML